jgi:UDP-N-acetylglucosamine--N-acetylmuramyl-(pentapeptide) pyrophosphoryl-undecaprenol N-acetylglucosamine transferase
MSVRLIIAGGGTGGHIFPAVAIANAMKALMPDCEILFIGALGKMEMEKVPQAGYKIEGLDIMGFNRSSYLKNIALPYKLVKSFFQVRKIFREFKPDAALGVGGYSSFPVLRYAQRQGIPTFIHESNAFAGKANQMLGKRAERVFVATTGMEKFFPSDRIIVSGNPVRSAIADMSVTREEGITFFGLDPAKKTVLSIGGSLGAKSINEALEAGLNKFREKDLQLIWQTGKPFISRAREAAGKQSNVFVSDFITKMEYAFAAADLVISRAGAMAIAELCIVAKPAVLVPYPFAAEDHQTANALALVNAKAAVMIQDDRAQANLLNAILKLTEDEEQQEQLRQNIHRLAFRNADQRVAAEIIKTLEN